jgi:glucan phosphoethanolaminetransferase (alkaline phosphatase superfamily)
MEKIDLYLQSMWEAVTFEFALKLAILYFFITWIVLIIWVIKDISIRTNNIFYQIFSVLIILTLTPLGIFIYLLIRPRRTLYDRYYEEIEENLEIFNQIVEERKKEAEKKVDSKFQKTLIEKVDKKISDEKEYLENKENTIKLDDDEV